MIEAYCDMAHEISVSYPSGNGSSNNGILYIEDTFSGNETGTINIKPYDWSLDDPYQWSDGKARTVTIRVYREVHDTKKYQIPGTYPVTIEPYTMYLLDIQAGGDASCNFKVDGAKGLYYQKYQKKT